MSTQSWHLDEPTKMPEGAYFDEEDFLHDADGKYLPDGIYITKEGTKYHYEMFFNTGRFDLLQNQ